ncbi:MAG: YceI family protein [Verrucomicrobia bacterium]|nr:YceI family protein [Verrucomicrobiota bacterium]
MKKHHLSILLSLLAFAGATLAPADTFKIDPVHSAIIFEIGHFGVGHIYGRFDTFSGTFTLDQSDASKDTVSVEIKTDSVDTNFPDRDKHIKSPDFFNAAQFPSATFKSTSVKKVDDKTYEVTGDFTLRGVTKPLTLNVQAIGSGPGPKGEFRSGWEATATLKRSDFEVKTFLPAVTDEVLLRIAVEGIKQ